jgi:hypothetical protein
MKKKGNNGFITIFVTLTALSFLTGVASAEVWAIGGGCVGEDGCTFGFTVHNTTHGGEFVYQDHNNGTTYKADTVNWTDITSTTITFEGELAHPANYTYRAVMEETNKTTKEQGTYSVEIWNESGYLVYKSEGRRKNGNVQVKVSITNGFAIYETRDVYIGMLTPVTVHSYTNVPVGDLQYTLIIDDCSIGKGKVGELKTFYYVPSASGTKEVVALYNGGSYVAGIVNVWIKKVNCL